MTRLILPALAAFALSAGAASAQNVAVGTNVGTTGVGFEAQLKLGPVFVLRANVEQLDHDIDESYDGIDYSGAFAFDTVGGFIDMHPMANGFLISGGAYVGDRDIALAATPTGPVNIGGQTYTPGQVGTLNGAIKLSGVAPFLGIGWGGNFPSSNCPNRLIRNHQICHICGGNSSQRGV